MRFHKAELAFFVFIALLAGSTIALMFPLYRLGVLPMPGHSIPFTREMLATGIGVAVAALLLITGLIFGLFYIYPILRIQVREEAQLREMTQSLSQRSESLEQAALTDGLTGMQNRRYFDGALQEYLKEFRRIERPVGLMILDLDNFKLVNDTYGHDVGDEVLRSVAKCLHEFTRFHDVVARLGGEEFAVVAPNMDAAALEKFAERIRQAISMLSISTGNVRLKVTMSIGVAVWNGREEAGEFYRRADRMLYRAKREGRNRVCA